MGSLFKSWSWFKSERKMNNNKLNQDVFEELKKLYETSILPLEKRFLYHDFHSGQLENADFEASSMLLLVGQHSSEKTTFIKYFLNQDFPGTWSSLKPTTDCFNAVMYGEQEDLILGKALVADPEKHFGSLDKFGNTFLNQLQCSTFKNDKLKQLTIIDAPGILLGEKHRVERKYDFTGVLQWFAQRADRILFFFDAHMLNINDEFRSSIKALQGHERKIRIVLNKADMIEPHQLLDVTGALAYSLGKVLNTPIAPRVYTGSFRNQPLRYIKTRMFFGTDEQDLFSDITVLPRDAASRNLSDLIKRARRAKVHAYIISTLREKIKDLEKKELIRNLSNVYLDIEREFGVPAGDFPNLQEMQEKLIYHDFTKFPQLKKKKNLIDLVDKELGENVSKLISMISKMQVETKDETVLQGGANSGHAPHAN